MTIAIDLSDQVQLSHYLGRLFQIDIGDRHHLAVEQGLAATTDMIAADGTGADHA